MFKLVYEINGVKNSFVLKEGITVVGRSGKCDLRLNERSISGMHLQLKLLDGNLTCLDLDSSNGTLLNGKKARQAELSVGDKLVLGRIKFSIESADADGDTTNNLALEETPAPGGRLVAIDGAEEELDATPANGSENEKPFDPTETPAWMVPASGGGGGAIQVIPPADNDEELKAQKRKLIMAVSGGVLLLVLIVILLIPSGDSGDKNANIPAYGSNAYFADIKKGIDLYDSQAYDKAIAAWEAADKSWRKHNPNQQTNGVTSRLSRLTRPLAEASKTGNYLSINWVEVAQEARYMIEDADMNDEVYSFVDRMRKKALLETGSQANFRQAQEHFDTRNYSDAIQVFQKIPQNSVYFAASQEKINEARNADYDKMLADIRLKARRPNCNWKEVVRAAEPIMRLRENPDFNYEVVKWREYAEQQESLEKLAELTDRNANYDHLSQALAICESIPQTSPYYAEASAQVPGLKTRMIDMRVKDLYAAADLENLKNLGLENPELSKTADYTTTLKKLEDMKTALDKADAFLKINEYFEARRMWEEVLVTEPNPQHPCNVTASSKLREWSLDRLGKDLVTEGLKHMKESDYTRARKLFEEADEMCGIDVSAERAQILKIAHSFYVKAQLARGRNNFYDAEEQARKAKECLIPGKDELYEKIEKFLIDINAIGNVL